MRLATLLSCLLVSTSLLAQVPSNGLVVHFDFNGNHTENQSGVEGEPNNVTFTEGADGTTDGAALFNGSNSYIAFPEEFMNGNDAVTASTFMIRFRADDLSMEQGLWNKDGNWRENRIRIYPDGHIDLAWAYPNYYDGVGSSAGVITEEAWHTAVFLLDQNSGQIFIDGEETGYQYEVENSTISFLENSPCPADIRCNRFGMVRWGGAPSRFFNGAIDEFAIWNRALSETEVTALFTGMAPVPGCTDETACNYQTEANVDDGSCVPSGCMEEGACNYNAAAECEGEACDYSCCPGPGCCGAGTHWNAILATCVVDVPDTVDEACTLMNLQELASGYAALVEQNAALDSLLAACEGDGAAEASGPCAGQNHVTYHGHDYAIGEIGDQCWFAENLRTAQYSNGDVIPTLEEDGEWATSSEGAKCLYNNDSQNLASYGYLYNWYTGSDSRGLCPAGWHVPSQSDLAQIEIGLGMSEQDAFSEGWKGASIMVSSRMRSTDWGGTDEVGIAVKPAPWRGNNDTEATAFLTTTLWDSDVGYASTENCWTVVVVSYGESNYHADSGLPGSFSVRCVKD